MLEQIAPDNLYYTGKEQLHELGELYVGPRGKKYVYGKFELGAASATTVNRGHFVFPHISAANTFGGLGKGDSLGSYWGADYTDGVLADKGYVGVALGQHLTTTSYGWFQVAGVVTAIQGTTEAIVDGDPLRLKDDKQPTKFSQEGNTTGGALVIQSYVSFGLAMENFSAVTNTLKKKVALDGKNW